MFGKRECKAFLLVSLMIISTQISLIGSIDFSSELNEEVQRFESNNGDVTIISVGNSQSCAIGTDNKMKCWGDGDQGKTGHENTEDYGDETLEMGRYLYFTDVGTNLTFLDVALGDTFSCALVNDSSIRCWGENDKLGNSLGLSGSGSRGDGYLEMGSNVNTVNIGTWLANSIEAGGSHACAVVNNGTDDSLVCWGENSVGQLGLGSTDTVGDDVGDLESGELPHVDLPNRGGITSVTLGKDHTCILWADGEIGCWGDNSAGQLGIGNTDTIGDESNEMSTNLVLVDLPSDRTATAITAGNDFTCAILDDASIACWGEGSNGRLGTGTITDEGDESDEIGDDLNIVNVGSGLGVISADAGDSHICAILTNNQLKCWGKNDFGQLGYGNGLSIGDDDNEMGDSLDAVSLGTGITASSVKSGDSFTCALTNNDRVKCWGSGEDGRTGLGKTGATGDEPNEMGNYLEYVELFMPLEVFNLECDVEAEGVDSELLALDSTSNNVGNKVSTTLSSKSCASMAYVDDEINTAKFGIYNLNKWTIEEVYISGTSISDTSITLDSNDIPHLLYMDTVQPIYYTKYDGEWTSTALSSSWLGSSVDIEIDSLGNLYLFSLSSTELNIVVCLESSDCLDTSSWTEVGSISVVSGGYGLDSDISYDDKLWIGYVDETSGDTDIELSTCSSSCEIIGNWQQVIISNLGDISTENASVALDIGANGSVHVAHNNLVNGLQYSNCYSSCESASSWTTEEILQTYSTGVIDIGTGPDLSVVIIVGTSNGEFTLHKKDNQWNYNQVRGTGDSGWLGIEITDLGQMWGFAFYPDNPNSFYQLRQQGMTTPGLELDIDGDGWMRVDEDMCGTNFRDSTSIPIDTDADYLCEIIDGAVSGNPSIGESDVLALGEKFGCALLSDGSVACWGDNSEGQLGNSVAGADSEYAVLVDLPDGFTASSIDAGSGHACSVGEDFSLVCWGRNTEGQLGRGTFSTYESPNFVNIPTGLGVNKFAIGTNHNCMKTSDGEIYCWGESDDERLGKILNPAINYSIVDNFENNDLDWTRTIGNYFNWDNSGFLYKTYYNSWSTDVIESDAFSINPGSVIQIKVDALRLGDNGGTLEVFIGEQLISTLTDSDWHDNIWTGYKTINITVPDSILDNVGLKFRVYCYRCTVKIDDLNTENTAYGGVSDLNIPTKLDFDNSDSISEIALGDRHSCTASVTNSGDDEIYCWGYNGGINSNVLGNYNYYGINSYLPQLVDLSGPDSLVSSNWSTNSIVSINAGSDTTCSILDSLESVCWGKSALTEYINPSIDTVASTGDIGRHPALMLDSNNYWNIAFYDSSNSDLRLAYYDGVSWNVESVYAGSNDVGEGVTITLDGDGNKHLVAYDHTDDEIVHMTKMINSTELIANIDGNSYNPATVVDSEGNIHIAYLEGTTKTLQYIYYNGTSWSSPILIDDYLTWSGYGTNDLQIDSSGNLHLSYYNWNTAPSNDPHELTYATYNGSVWSTYALQEMICSGACGTNGFSSSIEIDVNDRPHISYYDQKNDTLRYTHYDGTSWTDETVTTDDDNNNGIYNSISLDNNDYPRIAYYNVTHADLDLAVWDGSTWSFQKVDTMNSVGTYPSISIGTDDLTRIAYTYASQSDIKYASSTGTDWNFHTFEGSYSSIVSLGLDDLNNPRISAINIDGTDNVVLFYNNSNEWIEYNVEDNSGTNSNHPSMFVNSDGTAYIAYVNAGDGFVRYSTIYTGTIWNKNNIATTGDVSTSYPGLGMHFDRTDFLNLKYIDSTDSALKSTIVRNKGDLLSSLVDGENTNSGKHSSIVVDSAGNTHVSYYNISSTSLMYAKYNNSWAIEEVDNTGTSGVYTSIVIDDQDMPHISYQSEAKLKYAKYNGSGWELTTIDDESTYLAYETSIELDTNYNPHIAYRVQNYTGSTYEYHVKYAHYNGTNWTTEDVKTSDRSNWNSYSSTGRDVSIALNSTNTVFITYYDDYWDDLYIANKTGNNWTTSKIADNAGGNERSASIIVDSTDSIHLAYYDRSGYDLHYAFCQSSCELFTSWIHTLDIDSSSYNIGTYVSIALDSDNNPHIGYYDSAYADLEYAYCTDLCSSASSWVKETISSDNNVGYHVSISVDSNDNIYFSYYNASNTGLEIINLFSGIDDTTIISPIGSHHYQLGFVNLDGTEHLSYYNGTDTSGKLQYSTINLETGLWGATTVDESSTKTGLYSDIDLDSYGNPHISYFDSTNNKIKYAYYDSSSWVISDVATVGENSGYTSIVINSINRPNIAYHDSTTGDLMMAKWDGNSWTILAQDEGSAGLGTDISVDNTDMIFISYYDETTDDLEFVTTGYESPILTGNSYYHISGTSLDNGSGPIKSIDIGETHACAIMQITIKCWGSSQSGQLGNGVVADTSLSPVSVNSVGGFTPLEVSVSINSDSNGGSSCALYSEDLTNQRVVMCWGYGENGQIGDGADISLNSPSSTSKVSIDFEIALGIAYGSDYVSTGQNDPMKISLSSTSNFGCAMSYKGHVKCWGYNGYGQLGIENTTNSGDSDNEMGSNLKFVSLGVNRTAKDISLGGSHACAILDNNQVKCWGYNGYGQLGIENNTQIGDNYGELWGDNHPSINLGTGRTAVAISTGFSHTCVILDTGDIKCWGYNGYGQLGIGSTATIGDNPNEMGDNLAKVDLGYGRTALAIVSGTNSNCAILDSGLIKCWGRNNVGQLGIGSTTQIGDNTNEMGNNLEISRLGTDTIALSLSGGGSNYCALTNNRDIKCWGHNGYGQLGIENTTQMGDNVNEMGDNLIKVDLGTGRSAIRISTGSTHTCVILDNEDFKCWGYNGYGQLGIGSNTQIGDNTNEMGDNLISPELPLNSIKVLESGNHNTCAILFDNTIRCWGYNGYGQLGIGSTATIGDNPNEMGNEMAITNLHLIPKDSDGDGWIDLWDNDDDNDGYLDIYDHLPHDSRDWRDYDGDGLGTNVDTDDDDSDVKTVDQDTILTWSDEEEIACGYLPWSSLSTPADYDGDGICDALDMDLDGNGWNNTYQKQCYGEEIDLWKNTEIWGNTASANVPYSTYDGAGYGGYDFLISDYGIKSYATYSNFYLSQGLMRHDESTSIQYTNYVYYAYDYFEVLEQNGIIYVNNEEQIIRFQDINNTGTGTTVSSSLGQGPMGSDMAISKDGDMVVSYNQAENKIVGNYLNGTVFSFNLPSNLGAGGQIAFGPNGRLHLIEVDLNARDSDLPIGFYHYFADLNNSLSGYSSMDWSTGQLVLERNQSTTSYSANTQSDADSYHADLHVTDAGNIYAAMYNNTDLWSASYAGSTWTNQKIAEDTGNNEGIIISSDSSGTPHIGWINHTSDKLIISIFDSSEWIDVEIWESDGWAPGLRRSKLSLRFDSNDDLFLMSYNANSTNSALIHHKVPLINPAYSYNPVDHDTDGICDSLQYSIIDYGSTTFQLIEGNEVTINPTFRGLEIVEVYSTNLPSGLSLNSTTGIITGSPTDTDLIGTSVTVYSNSSNSSYTHTITIYVISKTPTIAGVSTPIQVNVNYERTQHEYDSEGNLYYYGRYSSTTIPGEFTPDGISISGLTNDDAYVAKRFSNGTWAWFFPINGTSTLYTGNLAVDDLGNSYIVGNRDSGVIDLPGTVWDLPSGKAPFIISIDNTGSIRWAKDMESTGSINWKFGVRYQFVRDYGHSELHIDNATGELTFSGSISSTGVTQEERTATFGNLTLEIGTSYTSYYRPFVFKMDSLGEFIWVQSITPSYAQHSPLQGMAVQENGTVSLLWKSYSSSVAGSITVGENGVWQFILANINSTGHWTNSKSILEETDHNRIASTEVGAKMESVKNGDIVIAMWSLDDTSKIRISDSIYWFNETCVDSLAILRLDGTDWQVENSLEICLAGNGGSGASKTDKMEVDSQDRIWLFIGSTSLSNHNRIIRLDSILNTDFEEYFTYANNRGNSFYIYWQDVTFDNDDNVFLTIYNNAYSSLWWDESSIPYTYNIYYRNLFLMDKVRHTIDGKNPVFGEQINYGINGLSAMGGSDYDQIDSYAISPDLPDGLEFNIGTGVISGTAITNSSLANYTIWVNDTLLGNQVLNIAFEVLNGKPNVTYEQTEFIFERGAIIAPIVPTEINGTIVSWNVVPALPFGLSMGESNGTIWGIPTVNLTSTIFNLQVSSDGATRNIYFNFTINEPLATITYGNGSYIVGRDSLVSIFPALGGGEIASFGITPTSLPMGLEFNPATGSITGTPLLVVGAVNYTVFANNSGGSVNTSLILTVTGSGISLVFPTSSIELVNGSEMQPIAGQTSGSAPNYWEISPELQDGLEFGIFNGTIWGTPSEVMNSTTYIIWANTTGGETANAELTISVLIDTDGDGTPDTIDIDDDNDGWSDIDENNCGNNPLDNTNYPSDSDADGICDSLDTNNDADIIILYPTNELYITVNQSFTPLVPFTSGGDITGWEVSPNLPFNIELNSSTGVVSGMATTIFNATTYTIWANNSAYSGLFNLSIISSLLDTDGDGSPDETDLDDDGDGWTDTDEITCLTNPLDLEDLPVDSDGDGICDGADPVNDSEIFFSYPYTVLVITVNSSVSLNPYVTGGDVITWEIYPQLPENLIFNSDNGLINGEAISEFLPTNFTIWANNSQYSSMFIIELASLLLDTDEDGVPDETDIDDDGDGWTDSQEINCSSDPLIASSIPPDSDEDNVCDNLDDVNDAQIYLTYSSLSQNLFVNEPMDYLVATVYGGDVREWEISPELPLGLNLDNGVAYRSLSMVGTGLISGSPMYEFPLTIFTVWANNSQHSDSIAIALKSSIPDLDDSYFDLLYLEDNINLTIEFDELYLEPEIFGGNVTNWSIIPQIPEGLIFNFDNGVISGQPLISFNETIFSISASNSIHIDIFNLTLSAQYLDSDLDGIPDIIDEDDDGDGWNDTMEIDCETEPLEFYLSPGDTDGDGMCNLLDTLDDSPILFFYPNDKIIGIVGEEIQSIVPRIAPSGGDILEYSVSTPLPDGLIIDIFTGVISGTPLVQFDHLILEFSHTITASNGQYNFSYSVDFDIIPKIIEDLDTDGDGWTNQDELSCNTSQIDPESYPQDIDLDGKCELMDDDDDGDGRADEIDAFANNSYAWEDTDGDGIPDDVTCKYSTNSSYCISLDLIADTDDDGDGWNDTAEISCGTNPKNGTNMPLDDDENGVCDRLEIQEVANNKIFWIVCFPLVLILLLLFWLLNPFGVNDDEIRGPEPPYTKFTPKIQEGTGEYDNPFILKSIKGVRAGGSTQSRELIKITNITPRLEIDFINLSTDDDNGRFSMKNIKANSRGEIEFRLDFNDYNISQEGSKYSAFMRIGKASVYLKWDVEVKNTKDLTEEGSLPVKNTANTAVKVVEAEATRLAEEAEATRLAEEAEADQRIKRTLEEMAISEVDKIKERKIRLAEEKKVELLRRVAEKAKTIDFDIIGYAATADVTTEITPGLESITLGDASSFPESGNAYIKDEKVNISIKWTGKDGDTLIGISGINMHTPIGSMIVQKDNLQDIKGIGPFIEEKLNALSIYTFNQISNMTHEIEEQVNNAIEFFPGRIRRDEWVKQAYDFLN